MIRQDGQKEERQGNRKQKEGIKQKEGMKQWNRI